MATSGVEKSSKKKTEKKLAAREEAKLLAGFMGVMNNMRKQVRAVRCRAEGRATAEAGGGAQRLGCRPAPPRGFRGPLGGDSWGGRGASGSVV